MGEETETVSQIAAKLRAPTPPAPIPVVRTSNWFKVRVILDAVVIVLGVSLIGWAIGNAVRHAALTASEVTLRDAIFTDRNLLAKHRDDIRKIDGQLASTNGQLAKANELVARLDKTETELARQIAENAKHIKENAETIRKQNEALLKLNKRIEADRRESSQRAQALQNQIGDVNVKAVAAKNTATDAKKTAEKVEHER